MHRQRTIREKVTIEGIGLHSGRPIRMDILPANENNGITFLRTDMGRHAELRACIEHVADTTLATTLAVGVNGSRAVVGTVEHLLAALAGLGIDNAQVLVDGPEIPVLDGSAAPFVELLQAVGTEEQRRPKRVLAIRKEVTVRDGDKLARIRPSGRLNITCAVDFDHPLIPNLPYRFAFSERNFVRDLARARTFGFLRDVEALRARGLARGGSLENAVIIDQYRVLNPDGLRYPDEFVRHNVLDAIGDLSLFGMPVVGNVELRRSGHALNTQLVRAVLADARAYEIVERQPGERTFAAENGRATVLEAAESVA